MTKTKHDTIYEILLVLFMFGMLLSVGTLAFVKTLPKVEGSSGVSETNATLTYVMYINGLLAAFALATLLLRYMAPDLGRVFTKALNISLLICFPIGTVLGIYGLLKVDRVPTIPSEASGL